MKHLERGFDLTIGNRDVKVIFSFFYFIKFLQNNSYKLILILWFLQGSYRVITVFFA